MRRKEFEVKDREKIDEVLKKAAIGYLSFNGADGWPRITPVNFFYEGKIFWHGAVGGERFECLKQDPRATFVAVSAQLYLPSHFLSEENATSATAAFKSVQVRGRCKFIEDLEEKCLAINRLMEKYQPEGRFKKVSPSEPMYGKVLRATGVYALAVEQVSAKFKLAQNKSREDRQKIISRLIERGGPPDLLIAEEVRNTLK